MNNTNPNKKNSIKEFIKKSENTDKLCFLHSGIEGKSILAWNPKYIFKGSDIEEFKKFTQKYKKYLLIGYLSYDLSYNLYKIKKHAKEDLKLPLIYFQAFDKFKIFNEHKNRTSEKKLEEQKNVSKEIKAEKSKKSQGNNRFTLERTKKEYNKLFKIIKSHIKEGDIYQINLTHRLKAKTSIPSRKLFLNIIRENPVNFLAYLEGEDFEILSASPERFIKIEDKKIETCPIKGTSPRGKTNKKDKKNKEMLLKSPKEEAELNMITDLLRNDLGKICKIGTVKVKKHRQIQKNPTVWHTFSKITGEIKTSPLEALLSMFPGGSITGCPKKRAIEIIDKTESVTRGVYTGTIGYITPNQNLDFNIAIRTIIKKGEKLYLQVGGGIVIDSNQEKEFQETLNKANSFTKIFEDENSNEKQ